MERLFLLTFLLPILIAFWALTLKNFNGLVAVIDGKLVGLTQ
jgi:hypothetical protein